MPTPSVAKIAEFRRAQPRELEDRGRVIDHRVDPGHLLQGGEHDADDQRHAEFPLEQGGEARPLAGEIYGHVVEFGIDVMVRRPVDAPHGGARLRAAAPHHQPARARRHQQNAGAEGEGGDRAQAEHPAPPAGIGEGVIDEVGGENPNRHRELVQRDERAADRGGSDFRQVERRDEGGDADRPADEDAARDQPADRLCCGGGKRAKHEHRRGDDDEPAAAVAIGEGAAHGSADNRAGKGDAGDHLLQAGGQREFPLEIKDGSGNGARIVAEQHSAERADQGDNIDEGHDGTRGWNRRRKARERRNEGLASARRGGAARSSKAMVGRMLNPSRVRSRALYALLDAQPSQLIVPASHFALSFFALRISSSSADTGRPDGLALQ